MYFAYFVASVCHSWALKNPLLANFLLGLALSNNTYFVASVCHSWALKNPLLANCFLGLALSSNTYFVACVCHSWALKNPLLAICLLGLALSNTFLNCNFLYSTQVITSSYAGHRLQILWSFIGLRNRLVTAMQFGGQTYCKYCMQDTVCVGNERYIYA